jgi:hypothetical protein
MHKPWYRPSTIARLRRALLDGYDPRVSPDQPVFQLHLIQHLLCHWLGVLKPAAVPYHVRRYRQWTGLLHRRELARLVARLHEGPRPSYA